MSYRNSFCTEYIYDEQDEKVVFDKLSQSCLDVHCNYHIISGFIKNSWCFSTPYDLQEILTGVKTKNPITFATVSEDGNHAKVDACRLENGQFIIFDDWAKS